MGPFSTTTAICRRGRRRRRRTRRRRRRTSSSSLLPRPTHGSGGGNLPIITKETQPHNERTEEQDLEAEANERESARTTEREREGGERRPSLGLHTTPMGSWCRARGRAVASTRRPDTLAHGKPSLRVRAPALGPPRAYPLSSAREGAAPT
ncbi:unnamed protein product [Prorocentrum cordatum]|uniref:Uncharacterized protein n=1 Tax=Prorocentrum cordatum TaxID=2364126 RepID=A0ABN9VX84_9DINO|nr:unnamed protein product [Polarella glacialis]